MVAVTTIIFYLVFVIAVTAVIIDLILLIAVTAVMVYLVFVVAVTSHVSRGAIFDFTRFPQKKVYIYF